MTSTADTGQGAVLSDLTIAQGSTAFAGGGVSNAGLLTIRACTITGNTAGGEGGGGIYNDLTGSLTLVACTISGNSASSGAGGGIRNVGQLGLANCTIYDNTAATQGGAIFNYDGRLELLNCTVVGNAAGADSSGGIVNIATVVYDPIPVYNSIVANGPGASDLTGRFFDVKNSLIGGNPGLGALANNGGPTNTMLPLAGSPAINTGDNSLIDPGDSVDQRGVVRINQGTVDIGAVESGPPTVVVTTLADEDNGSIYPSTGAGTSLREAIAFANTDPNGGITITFAAGLQGQLNLTLGALPTITSNLSITGPGLDQVTVDAQGNSGILTISGSATAAISWLDLSDGSASRGGAIVNLGTLRLADSALSGSTATTAGGIDNLGTLTLDGCTLSGNTSKNGGGGVYNDPTGTLTVTACTLSGNNAETGAAIRNQKGTLTLIRTTISGNKASAGGGIYTYGGSLTDCTISNNSAITGGGIFSDGGSLTDCTISNNSATTAGGVFNYHGSLTG